MNHSLYGPATRNLVVFFLKLLYFCFIDRYIQKGINDVILMSVWVSFGGKIMDIVNDAFINYSKHFAT